MTGLVIDILIDEAPTDGEVSPQVGDLDTPTMVPVNRVERRPDRLNQMPTFIDESGDTGAIEAGGKPYFRLAAVWSPSYAEADRFRSRIRELRRSMGLRTGFEFRFANTGDHPERRSAFFAAAMRHEFLFAVSAVSKHDPYWNRAPSSEQHWACATELASTLRPVYKNAEAAKGSPLKETIVVDNNQDKLFLKCIKAQFRGILSDTFRGRPFANQVSFRGSASDELLPLVDMVCGATGAFLDGKQSHWYELIADRDLN